VTGAGAVVEVAHEALFRVWPRPASWLTEERDFLIGRSRIRQNDAGSRSQRWRLADHPARFRDEAERAYIERSDAAARVTRGPASAPTAPHARES